jgi:hypothetical protein
MAQLVAQQQPRALDLQAPDLRAHAQRPPVPARELGQGASQAHVLGDAAPQLSRQRHGGRRGPEAAQQREKHFLPTPYAKPSILAQHL